MKVERKRRTAESRISSRKARSVGSLRWVCAGLLTLLTAAGIFLCPVIASGASPDDLFREARRWELGHEEFVPDDPAMTRKHGIYQSYRAAAGEGHVEAMYRLAHLNSARINAEWLESAALLGHGEAFRELKDSGSRLTLNAEIQAIAEEELDVVLKKYSVAGRQTGGCILVAEPKTGRMLAMAYRVPAESCAFRYEPGGSFFPVTVAAALDSGKLALEEKIDCSRITSPAGLGGVGAGQGRAFVIADILRKTCNPGIVRLAWKLGIPAYRKYMAAFGFASPSGGVLEDSEERHLACVLPDEPDEQKRGEQFLSMVSCGRLWPVTPLQMLQFYAAISNGGVRAAPVLLENVKKGDARIMSAEAAEKVKQALAEASGVGLKKERNAELRLIGKSGTAHRMKPDGRYDGGRYTLSYAGIMTVGRKELVCVVVLDDPDPRVCREGGGLKVCAPIFRNVARRLVPAGNVSENPAESIELKKKIR